MTLRIPTSQDVLCVEDNPADARLISELMKTEHFNCTLQIVPDGEQAMEYLHRTGSHWPMEKPALVLLDLNLPKKNGYEVLQEMKADPELKYIPVVVFSSSASSEDISKSYALFASCYIVKPPTLPEYDQVIQRIREFWLQTVQLPDED